MKLLHILSALLASAAVLDAAPMALNKRLENRVNVRHRDAIDDDDFETVIVDDSPEIPSPAAAAAAVEVGDGASLSSPTSSELQVGPAETSPISLPVVPAATDDQSKSDPTPAVNLDGAPGRLQLNPAIPSFKKAVANSVATTTTAAVAAPSPAYDANGFPIPDLTYNTTSSGLVTVLMLSDQLSSPYGQYVTRNARIFTSTPTNGNSNLKIELKKFPAGQDYNEYLNQLRSACDQGLTDAFDVVMLEATVLGEFADCLVDLSAWDAKMTDGFATQVIANSYVNKRLVSLPTEVDFGVMFFNNDVLEKYSSGGPPTNFDEIESKSDAVLRAMRAVDNYGFSGFTGQLRGEYLTAQVAEWLAGYNKSMIVDPKTGLVAIETNSAARVINRVSTWTGINIIDPSDFTLDAAPLYLTPTQIDNLIDLDGSLARFVNERSLFLRHWASTYYVLLKNSISFGWGVGPVVGWDASQNVGALGGWGVGVFKYSDNPAAAVKVASWLASNQMQRGAITTDKIKKIPSRTNLYNDKDVCKVLDQDICDLARNVQFAIRPSSLVGRHYANVTKMISSQMATFFLTPETIVEALTQLSIDLHTELGQPRTGGAININPPAPGKTVPSHMQIQLMGLCGVILVSCTVIYLTKRKQIDENIKEAGDKLKVLAQTAKQEVIMKTQKRADLDFGANEFTHLDEEMDEDDKKVGLAKKGAQPGYSAVKEAEKDDFV